MAVASASLAVLDDTCSRCQARGEGTYKMVATCLNCGTKAVVVLSRGHETPGYSSGPECPACGNHEWVGWQLA